MKAKNYLVSALCCIMAAFAFAACSDSDEVYVPTPTVVSTILGEYPVVTQAAFDSIVVGHGWMSYDYWEIDEETDTVIQRDEALYLEFLGYVPETVYEDLLGSGGPRKLLFASAFVTEFHHGLYYGGDNLPEDWSVRQNYSYDPASNTVSIGDGYLTLLSVTADTLKVIAPHGSQYTRKYEIFVRQSEETVQYWLDNYPLRESKE